MERSYRVSMSPDATSTRRIRTASLFAGMLAVIALVATMTLPALIDAVPFKNSMLMVHLLLEMFSIMIALHIVSLAWHTTDMREATSTSKILMCGFLIVASCDILHALTYKGMPDFITESGTPRAIFFWLIARTVEVVTLAVVASKWRLQLSRKLLMAIGLAISFAFIWFGSFHLDIFPVTFIQGSGVTKFKANYEYFLCFSKLLVTLALWRQAEQTGQTNFYLLALSSFVMGIGEIAFTSYITPSDFQNIFGHAFKVAAYALLYWSVYVTSVRIPFQKLRESEMKLRKSEIRYHSAISSLSEGVLILGSQSEILSANKAAADALGYSPEQLIGLRCTDTRWHVIHEDGTPLDSDMHPSMLALKTGTSISDTVMGIHKPDGSLSWISVNVEPMVNPDESELHSVVASFTDVTLRREAETQLRIAAIAFETQEAMMITDTQGKILRVNHAFTENTGYTAKDVVGLSSNILKSGRHDKTFYAGIWDAIINTGTWQGEVWDKRKNGEIYPNWLTITSVKDSNGSITHYVGTFVDIGQRKAAENQLHQLAFYDPLTKLPNRRLLLDRLDIALKGSTRSKRCGAVIFIDIDSFNTLNETQGYDVGDSLLVEVANRLQSVIRQGDTVARLGGDEFVVMTEDFEEEKQILTQVETIVEKIEAILHLPYRLKFKAGQTEFKDADYSCTASIGITLFGEQIGSVDDILKQADLAMHKAKSSGKNTVCFFDPKMQTEITARVALETELREALQHSQFVLHYQPQMTGEQLQLTGAEALVRWQHPTRGMVYPGGFIDLAEETSLILPLGNWVMKQACSQLAAWSTQAEMTHLTLAVNVSAQQFQQSDFVETVLQILSETGANPRKLKLELTESMLIDNVEEIIHKMTVLKAVGIGFSLDDFGTGYSSLSYLKRLPLDQLKIDQSFVRDILTDSNDSVIAKTVVALGESLGLTVIAEGVESRAQMELLAHHGCHAYQGYFFSKPLPLKDFEKFVAGAQGK